MKKLINKIRSYFGLYISWYHVNIYKTAKIGKRVSIGSFSEIGDEVFIGDDTKIQAFAFIPKGVIIGRNCFIGPRVTFTNDKYPPSDAWLGTFIQDGVSIGAGSIILPGITIGENSKVGAGSVVTKSVPENVVVFGNPARIQKKL